MHRFCPTWQLSCQISRISRRSSLCRPTSMTMGPAVSRTREANVLAAYKLLSEDASFVRNIYRYARISVGPIKSAGRSHSLQSGMTDLCSSLQEAQGQLLPV